MKRSTVTILASAAVLAAVSACSADMMGEFGTPHAEFEIKGMVADEQESRVSTNSSHQLLPTQMN